MRLGLAHASLLNGFAPKVAFMQPSSVLLGARAPSPARLHFDSTHLAIDAFFVLRSMRARAPALPVTSARVTIQSTFEAKLF